MFKSWPRHRVMSEDALDSRVLYLASDVSAHVTGLSFNIDTGQSLL